MSVTENRTAIIETSKGQIKVILNEDLAPITTANFIELA
jgi:cyclophilin family peptidyl-prolyl cis-trans isomerase